MRSQRNYINDDGSSNLNSSFLSCEKDSELIIRKLFVESRPYSDELKRLLLINNKDCLDDRTNPAYLEKIENTSIYDLVEKEYIRFQPKLTFDEDQEVRNALVFSFDNFRPNEENDYYRDCIIEIDILCHSDYWDLGNFRQRPIKIMGYIDGILNKSKLTGLGTLQFLGANELILGESLAGYCVMYRTVHGDEDDKE